MAQQYPGSWKYCATCAYWAGIRSADNFGQRVTVGAAMEKGKCAIPKGGWRGSQKQATGSCKDWLKWPVLK